MVMPVLELAQYRPALAAERRWVAMGSKSEAGNSRVKDSKTLAQSRRPHQHGCGVLRQVLEEKFLLKQTIETK